MGSPIAAAPMRPWTPPEDSELESSPRSDGFSDPFRSNPKLQPWSPSSSAELPTIDPRCDTPVEELPSRPKPISNLSYPTPYTPTKTFNLQNAPNAHGAPQYPYTPDSSRILRRSTELPSSPTPWDEYPEEASSPIQNALSSCISHVENLIQTTEPDEDQMEYIVGQFEAMASYLAAPQPQSKTTGDDLFEHAHGLGIKDVPNTYADSSSELSITSEQLDPSYVAHVGRYIESVQKHIEDLKMRLDEAKMLNSIQLDVIDDLRRQMRSVSRGLQTELSPLTEDELVIPFRDLLPEIDDDEDNYEDIEEDDDEEDRRFVQDSWETIEDPVPSPEHEPSTPPALKDDSIMAVCKPQRRGLWASFTEALDDFGSLLLED